MRFGLVITFIEHIITKLMTTLYKSLSHKLVFSGTVFTALLGNVFWQWMSLCFPHMLTGLWPSHNSLVMAADPHYIASIWTTERTLLSTACLLWPLCDGYWTIAWQQVCLQDRYLSTAVYVGFTVLCSSRNATIYIHTYIKGHFIRLWKVHVDSRDVLGCSVFDWHS